MFTKLLTALLAVNLFSSLSYAMPTSYTCTVRTATSTAGTGVRSVTVSCSGNEKIFEGSCDDDALLEATVSRPSGQGWYCVSETYGTSHIITAYANCCL